MLLCLLTEDVHLVLVQAFVRAELKLLLTVLKVHIIDGMTNMLAPIADFVLLEGGTATLGETQLTTEDLGHCFCLKCEELQAGFLAPGAENVTRRY